MCWRRRGKAWLESATRVELEFRRSDTKSGCVSLGIIQEFILQRGSEAGVCDTICSRLGRRSALSLTVHTIHAIHAWGQAGTLRWRHVSLGSLLLLRASVVIESVMGFALIIHLAFNGPLQMIFRILNVPLQAFTNIVSVTAAARTWVDNLCVLGFRTDAGEVVLPLLFLIFPEFR